VTSQKQVRRKNGVDVLPTPLERQQDRWDNVDVSETTGVFVVL
jgi:hypothetical protein